MAGSLLHAMLFYVKLDVKDLKKGKLFLLDKIGEDLRYLLCERQRIPQRNTKIMK